MTSSATATSPGSTRSSGWWLRRPGCAGRASPSGHRGHDGGIVPGTAGQTVRDVPRDDDRLAEQVGQDRSAGTARGAPPGRPEFHAPAAATAGPGPGDRPPPPSRTVARVADVEAEPGLARHDVGCAGSTAIVPTVRTGRDRSAETLDLQDELRRRRQRIVPAFHRQGPGMSRPAPESARSGTVRRSPRPRRPAPPASRGPALARCGPPGSREPAGG